MASNGISKLIEQSVATFALSALFAIYINFKGEEELMFTVVKWSLPGGGALWFITILVTQKLTRYLWIFVLPAAAGGGAVVGTIAFVATGI